MDGKSGWISYVCYKLRPEYRVMHEAVRFQLAAFLVEILESPHDRVEVDCFCSVGWRADSDFFVRYTAPTPDELQEICVKVNNSGLGRYLDISYNWLGLRRQGGAADEGPSSEVGSYFVLYPFKLDREWYLLSDEDREQMMSAYVKVGEQGDGCHAETATSFGLGDQDSIIGFQVADLGDFEGLSRRLRGTTLGKFIRQDTPMIPGKRVTAHEALEMCGAL